MNSFLSFMFSNCCTQLNYVEPGFQSGNSAVEVLGIPRRYGPMPRGNGS